MQLATTPTKSTSGVPVRQITRTRSTFKSRTLCYEVLLTSVEPWNGLKICFKLSQSGVRLSRVTYVEGGCLFLKLLDDGATNLRQLAEVFGSDSNVRVSHWTTIVPLSA